MTNYATPTVVPQSADLASYASRGAVSICSASGVCVLSFMNVLRVGRLAECVGRRGRYCQAGGVSGRRGLQR